MRFGNKTISMKDKGELILPVMMSTFALLYLRESLRLFSLDAMLLIRIVLIGVVILSVVVIIKQFRIHSDEASLEKSKLSSIDFWKSSEARKSIAFVCLTAVSLVLINPLGYILTFGGYLILMMYILGVRQLKILAFVPIGLLVFIYLLFQVWLMVPLPRGILG